MLALPLIAGIMIAAQPPYASTPQRAMVRIFGPAVRIIRTNVVGRFATVVSRGAVLEGEPVTDAILLEHFSFGWQPLDVLNARCNIDARDIAAGVKRRLLRGMPTPGAEPLCSGTIRDAGPADAVTSIRKQLPGPLVPAVAVAGNFGIGSWYGAGGGEWLFRHDAGRWVQVTGGGGAIDAAMMRQHGVPRSAWCVLGISDAGCPR